MIYSSTLDTESNDYSDECNERSHKEILRRSRLNQKNIINESLINKSIIVIKAINNITTYALTF